MLNFLRTLNNSVIVSGKHSLLFFVSRKNYPDVQNHFLFTENDIDTQQHFQFIACQINWKYVLKCFQVSLRMENEHLQRKDIGGSSWQRRQWIDVCTDNVLRCWPLLFSSSCRSVCYDCSFHLYRQAWRTAPEPWICNGSFQRPIWLFLCLSLDCLCLYPDQWSDVLSIKEA